MIVSPNSEKILSSTEEKITGPGNLYWICISVSIILYAYLLYAGGVEHSIYTSLLVATFLPTPVFLGHIEQFNFILNFTGGLPLGLPLYELALKQVVSQSGYGYIGFVPLVGVVHCFFAYKRLKELNLNKYLSLVVLVPLLGQVFLVMLGAVKTRPDLSRLKKLGGLNLLEVFIEKRTLGQQNFTAGYTPQDGFIKTLMHLFSFLRKCSLLEVWTVLIATASFYALYDFSKPNTDFSVLFQTPFSDFLVKGGILLLLVSLLVRRLRALNWSLWLILLVFLAVLLSVSVFVCLFLVLLLFVPTNADLKQLRLLNFPSNTNPSDNEDTQIMKPATEGQTAEKTKNTNAAQSIVAEKNANGTQTKKEPPITKRQDEKQLAISDINEDVQEAPWQYPVTVMDIETDKSGSNMKQFLEANSPILKAKRLAARPVHDGHKWVVLITSPSGQKTFNLSQVVELTQWVNKCR